MLANEIIHKAKDLPNFEKLQVINPLLDAVDGGGVSQQKAVDLPCVEQVV